MKHFYTISNILLLIIIGVSSVTSAFAQGLTIQGKVTAFGEDSGLPGVTIRIKNTNQGTTTDFDGNYKINVPSKDVTLIFSFVGYVPQEIPVNNRSTINVQLAEDIEQLTEVVVVGYGTQQKREITGSIAKVDGSKIAEMPTPSFEAALQGRAAGVQVIQGSGMAGSGSVIRIRGIASVSASGDPLYVVDGIPITQDPFLTGNRGAMNSNPLATLNPNDIESVEVLKDAAATGIYGSRGANGVILITTKRGKTGKPSFNFNTKFGIAEPTAKANMLNSQQYLQLYQEAWENDGKIGPAELPQGITWEKARATDTDWWDEVTQTGLKQEYNLSMNQGTNKLKTFAGVSYSNHESYLVGNSYERISGRVNLDYSILKNLKANFTSSLSRGINTRVEAAWTGGLGLAMSEALPIYPVYNEDGTLWANNLNPVWRREQKDWKLFDTRTLAGLNLDYKPLDRLTINIGGNIDYLDQTDDQWESGEFISQSHRGTAKSYETYVTNYNLLGTAEYLFQMPKNHNLKVLVGNEFQRYVREGRNDIELTDVTERLSKDPVRGETSVFRPGNSFKDDWGFLSYFTRFNYNLKDRYYFQASLRTDASSKFGPDSRWGYFPTVSGAWVVSDEAFLKESKVISQLKLRTSFGISGNSNFPSNQWIGTFKRPENTGYNGQPILYPEKLENPDLKWETATNFDAGFELGLFNQRFTTEFTFYNRLTSDVLMELSLQPSSGVATKYWENVGEIVNRGVEFQFTSYNLQGELKWTTNFNIARNYNEVKSIGGFSDEAVSGGTNDTRIIIGEPIGTNFLVRYAGVEPETGLPLYLDKDGNITYTWDPINRVAVGNVLPDFTGGITNSFNYKNFDLSFLFVFTKGGDIYDSSSKRQLGVVTTWNMREELFDRWRPDNTNAVYPRLTTETATYGASTPWINTDLWVHDGSYIRLRNLSFGYNLSSDLISKIGLQSARISFVATNLLTFTKYPGLDPEIARDFENQTDRNMSPNITYLTPPQEKTFNLGINVSF